MALTLTSHGTGSEENCNLADVSGTGDHPKPRWVTKALKTSKTNQFTFSGLNTVWLVSRRAIRARYAMARGYGGIR